MKQKLILPFIFISTCMFSCNNNPVTPTPTPTPTPVDPEEEEKKAEKIKQRQEAYNANKKVYLEKIETFDDSFKKAFNLLSAFEYILISNGKYSTAALQTLICFRETVYSGTSWSLIAGSSNSDTQKLFSSFKASKIKEGYWFNSGENYLDTSSNSIDFYHTIAVLNTYLYSSSSSCKDLSSFGGDTSQLVTELIKVKEEEKVEYAKKGGNLFSDPDLYSDIDGCNISYVFNNKLYYKNIESIAFAFADYYINLSTYNRSEMYIKKNFGNEFETSEILSRLKDNTYLYIWNKNNGISFKENESDFIIAIDGFIYRVNNIK